MNVCVCVSAESERGKEEVIFEVMYAWVYEICCMDNHEVIVRCHLKVNSLHLLLGLGLGPRVLKGKGKIWAFCP